MNIAEKLAQEFGIRLTAVEQTISLIDEGNTIPFIARYRKEVTGGLSDVVLRDLDERLNYLRGLEERKAEVIKLIEEQGKLTEEWKISISRLSRKRAPGRLRPEKRAWSLWRRASGLRTDNPEIC